MATRTTAENHSSSNIPPPPCQARLGTLRCTREAHGERGHVYVTGSWVPDKHGPVGS